MIDAGASRDVRAPEHEPVAGGRRAPSAPTEAGGAVGVPAERGQLDGDALGPLLARAVAQRAADRAQDAGDASADAPALLQRSPKAWTGAAATRTIAELTAGWGFISRWPAVQVLVARYGQLPEGGLEQREAVLGDIEHAMARWRSNQRESTGLKTDLDLSKRAALEALATQIAKERAEIAADRRRTSERAAALKARSAAPPTATPVAHSAPPPRDAVIDRPVMPPPPAPATAEPPLPVPTAEWRDGPASAGNTAHLDIGDFIEARLDLAHVCSPRTEGDLSWSVLIIEAHKSGDRARMADVEAQLVAAGLERSYVLPFNRHRMPTIIHPLLREMEPDIRGFTKAEQAAIDGKFRRKIYAAEQSWDPARIKSLEKELEEAGLEHRYQRPGYPSALSGKSTPGVIHPLGWVLLDEPLPGGRLGCVRPTGQETIPGFPAAKSVSVDGYFRRRIQAAATASQAARRELDAELIEAGLEHRYIRDVDDDVDPEVDIRGLIGSVMPSLGQPLIPGFSPMESARTDGHFRRRIREAVRSGDEALNAAVDAELIDQGLEFRYVRGFGSSEHGQAPGPPRYLDMGDLPDGALAPLSNPAGGDQAPPSFADVEPGAIWVGERPQIAGLSPQESTKLDGYFARAIRQATRLQDVEVREKLLADIDADLIRRGIEHRYIRAASADGKPLFEPREPAAGQGTLGRISLLQPGLIPGLSAERSAETDVFFRREIRKAAKSGKPELVNHVTAQLTAAGLADRYYWD